MKTVLQLSGDFPNQRIYPQLVSRLAAAGIPQIVYAPVRSEAEAAWSSPDLAGIPVHLRYILQGYHRLLFRTKIRRIARDLASTVDLSGLGLIHAHFLYSDGAVALRIKRERGIPYIVAVRNADINAFMKLRPDLAGIRNDVLKEASRVVFLSPVYQSALIQRLDSRFRTLVAEKSAVIPNGITDGWFSPPAGRLAGAEILRLLYVGDFTRNKNIPNLLRAVALVARARSVRLTLIGGGGDGEAEVRAMLGSGEFPFAEYAGRISSDDRLREVYRSNDMFVMPSFTETFGLVYIEALSQGLPIVHSHGQGVDGYFPLGTVAEGVDPADPADIAARIKVLAGRLPAISRSCVNAAKRFDWQTIVQNYTAIYKAAALRTPTGA